MTHDAHGTRRWPQWLAFVLVVVLLVLAMVQIDRQWQRLSDMTRILQEQAEDLRRMRGSLRDLEQTLATGVVASQHAAPSGVPATAPAHAEDAFKRARAAAARDDYAPGDWLMLSFGAGIKTLTPLVSSDAYAGEVQSYVMESLLTRDPDTLEWSGLLAESWQVADDGLKITFRLRPDLGFSDGQPLTARDVAFSYRFIMNEAIAAPRARAYYAKVAAVNALDERTVEFVFAEPYFNALALAGGMEVLPEHFYARFLEDPRRFNESRGLLLGSGPYRLADPEAWTPDQGQIELVRNPRYWGPVDPSFDRIVWRVIENDSARLTTFRNGDIDVYGARPREYRQLVEDAQLSARAEHHEYMSPTSGYSFVAWNQQRGGKVTLFADARVRRALSHLTDTARIIEDVFLGYGEVAVSPFSPRSPQHDPALLPIAYDLERARALLAEAGFADRDGDGVLENEAGQRFEFDLTFFQDNEDTRRTVLFLRDAFARAGVLMKPQPTEWSVMIDKMGRKDFDAITLAWTSGVEVDIFQMFHSTQNMDGGDNFISYANPEFDRIIDQARATVDDDARMALWHQAEAHLVADQPYTFLLRRKTLAFIDRRIHNVGQTNLGLNLMNVPVEVYVPKGMQRAR